ncbi:MAG: aminoacyl-tRNA hydrolase [Deltaproteobacteria bacterium]|nr:aminoacyl-tRNA hydrolase [Deltaproteobacteria bacterium]
MKLLVGLGNPGPRYAATRHNAGFLVLQRLEGLLSIPMDKRRFEALIGKGVVAGEPAVLAIPQTYMNLSGRSVAPLMKFYNLNIEDIIVIHDEIDFPFGILRIKTGGGHGGHKGLRSIIDYIGGADFTRLRVGIGRPCRQETVESYVLTGFSQEEEAGLPDLINRACDVLCDIVQAGPVAAMNRCNIREQNGPEESSASP